MYDYHVMLGFDFILVLFMFEMMLNGIVMNVQRQLKLTGIGGIQSVCFMDKTEAALRSFHQSYVLY